MTPRTTPGDSAPLVLDRTQDRPTGDAPVVLINAFEIPAAAADAFIAQWRIRAEVMAGAPGFRGLDLHRALDPRVRFQVVNVAHWASREALAAAQANPEFQAPLQGHLGSDPDVQSEANPAVYEVVLAYPASER